MFCVYAGTSDGCLLQICYEFFTRPVTEDSHLMYKIHSQLVQLVSNISVVEGGPAILFESSCHCCTEVSTTASCFYECACTYFFSTSLCVCVCVCVC